MPDNTAPKKQRSPSYPAVDLKLAIDKAKLLYTKINKSVVHADSILEAMGYTTSSGAVTFPHFLYHGK